jgi:hypothetical protein
VGYLSDHDVGSSKGPPAEAAAPTFCRDPQKVNRPACHDERAGGLVAGGNHQTWEPRRQDVAGHALKWAVDDSSLSGRASVEPKTGGR